MEEQWMLHTKKADFSDISSRFAIDPVTARIIRNRDVVGDDKIWEFLHGSLNDCSSPFLMKDMRKTVEVLSEKIKEKKKIRVIGDYDIDGVCSTYILVKALRRIGGIVDSDIPERVKDGYGLNIRLVREAVEAGIDTLLTCDNGIAAFKAIHFAKKHGLTVLVTDHHEVLFEMIDGKKKELLPPADAIVNPHQQNCTYPFEGLCGAAVAFKLANALYETWHISKDELSPFVEAAGLATVGDVMVLQGENRILVKEGMKRMEHSQIVGLKALIEANNLDAGELSCYHLGFVIGPCLNAAGRIETAKKALSLLMAEEKSEADCLALELVQLNAERKNLTIQNVDAAVAYIEQRHMEADPVYVICLPECMESLVGIVAGRIREQYQHPVFVFSKTETCLKGSGRSIPGYNMYEHLVSCKDLLLKFGGHPMAAGLSIPEENLEAFRKKLNEESGLTEQDFQKLVWIDVPMPFSYITDLLLRDFKKLEPFGNGNEKPCFAQKGLTIQSKKILGKNQNVLKLSLTDNGGRRIDAILFQDAAEADRELNIDDRISVTYYPSINEYMGSRTLQMVISGWKKCATAI